MKKQVLSNYIMAISTPTVLKTVVNECLETLTLRHFLAFLLSFLFLLRVLAFLDCVFFQLSKTQLFDNRTSLFRETLSVETWLPSLSVSFIKLLLFFLDFFPIFLCLWQGWRIWLVPKCPEAQYYKNGQTTTCKRYRALMLQGTTFQTKC